MTAMALFIAFFLLTIIGGIAHEDMGLGIFGVMFWVIGKIISEAEVRHAP